MTWYVEVKDGTPDIETKRPRPVGWRDNDGNLATDKFLREQHNLYPIDYRSGKPTIRRQTEMLSLRDPANWDVQKTKVVVTYDVEKFPLEKSVGGVLGLVRDTRYAFEVGGMSFSTDDGTQLLIGTSRASQGKITAEKEAASDNNRNDDELWKTANEEFVALTNSEIKRMWREMRSMIAASFQRESDLRDKVRNAADVSELESIMENDIPTGWPNNALHEV